jgi:Ala-tRNA(Pro) deacylase
MTEDEIYQGLAAHGIAVETLEHEPVFTVEQSGAVHAALPAAHTKNLFLRDKGGHHWLVVLPSDRRADLKALARLLDAGKFSFGRPEDMARLLHLTPGSVTPLGALNAPAGEVTVVFDAAFGLAPRIAVHPLRNTATIALSFDRLVGWLRTQGVPVRVMALT